MADSLFNLFNVGVIIGTVLALASTIGTIWTGGIKERYSDDRIAANELSTARANERAKALERDAEDARERTRLAEERILGLNVELTKLRSPRSLTAEQKAALASVLRQFSNISFDAAANIGDNESRFFLLTLMDVFQEAGWKGLDWHGRGPAHGIFGFPSFGDITGQGVVIVVDQLADDDTLAASNMLMQALNANDVPATTHPRSTDLIQEEFGISGMRTIHMSVGRKEM